MTFKLLPSVSHANKTSLLFSEDMQKALLYQRIKYGRVFPEDYAFHLLYIPECNRYMLKFKRYMLILIGICLMFLKFPHC